MFTFLLTITPKPDFDPRRQNGGLVYRRARSYVIAGLGYG